MILVKGKIVTAMAVTRCLSSIIELTAALLMLKFDSVETAMKINAALALIGPTTMITVTTLGLIGLAGKISVSRMLLILIGVCCIFIGVSKQS
ncbi:MAG: YqhV family protein [Firmicutes bacterium]|nr:YqhV family protein [Bacillota bacterium]